MHNLTQRHARNSTGTMESCSLLYWHVDIHDNLCLLRRNEVSKLKNAQELRNRTGTMEICSLLYWHVDIHDNLCLLRQNEVSKLKKCGIINTFYAADVSR